MLPHGLTVRNKGYDSGQEANIALLQTRPILSRSHVVYA